MIKSNGRRDNIVIHIMYGEDCISPKEMKELTMEISDLIDRKAGHLVVTDFRLEGFEFLEVDGK